MKVISTGKYYRLPYIYKARLHVLYTYYLNFHERINLFIIVVICLAGKKLQAIRKPEPEFLIRGILMRTGQRDVHNTPLKRRLSITYEELETLKKSIKVSVLNELRAEMENVSDHDSIKDLVLSEIRTELMGIPNPALLKASILNELRMELKASGGKRFGSG